MDSSSSSLRCLLMTIQGGRILLPNSFVVEVLPFATPLHIEAAPPWVVGAMLWHNLTTPLINLGRLIFGTLPEAEANSRIVIVNTLNADQRLPHIGLLGTGAPRPINLQRHELISDPERVATHPQPPGVLCWALYQDQSVLIPDFDAIEAALQPLMRRG